MAYCINIPAVMRNILAPAFVDAIRTNITLSACVFIHAKHIGADIETT